VAETIGNPITQNAHFFELQARHSKEVLEKTVQSNVELARDIDRLKHNPIVLVVMDHEKLLASEEVTGKMFRHNSTLLFAELSDLERLIEKAKLIKDM
jgi:hypothetical protein